MVARKRLLHSTVVLAILAASASPIDAQSNSIFHRATSYLKAQERVMQRGASLADIENLMSFYSSNYIYRDARVGITIRGIERVRTGSASHLGESRNATVRIEHAVADGSTVALKVLTSFTVTETGERVRRSNLVVLHFTGKKISERIDF